MHNIQSPEDREDITNQQTSSYKNSKNGQNGNDGSVTDHGLPDDSIDKSFEDEDNSIRSDDNFQTPSTSIHNLSSIQQNQNEEIEEKEIRSEIDMNRNGSISNQIDSPKLSPQVSYSGKDNKEGSPNSQDGTGSPAGSISLSPINVSGTSDLTQSTESNISRGSNSSGSGGGTTTNGAKNKAGLQPGTYNSKPSRKKLWYHHFMPSYKTRTNDFRNYFKDLPADERLIVDYSCAVEKEILVQGRMYISQNYLSFHANIFGWQTLISIKFKDISSMTKDNTALVIPNAVTVVTEKEKYFFTSFLNRDSTFIMLFKLWQTALLDQNMPPKEIWKLVNACYGEVEIGSEEESNEDYLSLSSTGSLVNAPSVSTLLTVSDGDDKSIDMGRVCSGGLEFPSGILGPAVIATSAAGIVNTANIINAGGPLANGIIGLDLIPSEMSDSSDTDEEQIVEIPIPVCPSSHLDGKTVVDTIIPCDVDTLFTMLFTNSKFYLDFHTSRKTFDIVQEEWQEKDGQTTRQVSFTVTLNQRMGPKHSQITETQVLLPGSKAGLFYAVDIESNNGGIPYADAFYVTCHFCLSRAAPQQSRLIIVAQVRYRKSIWGLTKSFIEKNSWVGIEEFYSSLEKSLKEECANLIITISPPPSPRPSAQLRRRLRKKGPAPGIPTGASLSASSANIPATVGGTGSGATVSSESTFITSIESPIVLKVIISILVTLLILNGFLYMKLSSLELNAGSPVFFAPQPITFTKDMPQNHQEWLELLQQQEALHRFELQKWHDILLSSLKIIKQAEVDLESLKYHIDSYATTRTQPSYLKPQKSEVHHPESVNANPTEV